MDLFERIDQKYEIFSKMPHPYYAENETVDGINHKMQLEWIVKAEKANYNNEALRDYVRMFGGGANLSVGEVKEALKKHKREVYDELYAIRECANKDALAEFEKCEKQAVKITYSSGEAKDPIGCGIYPQNPMWWICVPDFRTGKEILEPNKEGSYRYAYYFDADGRLIMVSHRINVDGKDEFNYEFTVFHYNANCTIMLMYTKLPNAGPKHILLKVSERWCDDSGFVKRFMYANVYREFLPLRDEVCREYLIEYNKGGQHATSILLNATRLIVEQYDFNLPEEKLRYLY